MKRNIQEVSTYIFLIWKIDVLLTFQYRIETHFWKIRKELHDENYIENILTNLSTLFRISLPTQISCFFLVISCIYWTSMSLSIARTYNVKEEFFKLSITKISCFFTFYFSCIVKYCMFHYARQTSIKYRLCIHTI